MLKCDNTKTTIKDLSMEVGLGRIMRQLQPGSCSCPYLLTFSGVAIFLYLFICIREPRVCDLVSIRTREDPGYETLGMQYPGDEKGMSVMWRPFNSSGVVSLRIIDVISRCHYKFTR